MEHSYYKWKTLDKFRYGISMIPFLTLFAATIIILSNFNLILPFIWVFIYLTVNFFQAGCCVGCPYRGKYCPAFCGVYLGNIMSTILYRKRQFDPAFFKRNAAGGEIMLIIFLLFPAYWIIISEFYYIFIYITLIILHIILFMPSQCSKCSYSETCPGGKAYYTYCKLLRRKK